MNKVCQASLIAVVKSIDVVYGETHFISVSELDNIADVRDQDIDDIVVASRCYPSGEPLRFG
jgi:hypothetical protein